MDIGLAKMSVLFFTLFAMSAFPRTRSVGRKLTVDAFSSYQLTRSYQTSNEGT